MSWVRATLLCLVGCGRVAFDDAPAAPTDPDLVLWFDMDAEPVSGWLGNTVKEGPAAACDAVCPMSTTGMRDGALELDGATTALRVSGAELGTPEGTIATWVRLDAAPSTYTAIVSKPYGVKNQNSWEIYMNPFSNAPEVTLLAGSDVVTGGYIKLTYPRPLGVWLHLACTWSEAQAQFTLYLDGVPAGTANFSPIYDGSDLVLGADIDNGIVANWLRGALDDVRLYRRVLTAEEIAELAVPR